jgi:hypothetical protein
MHLEILTDKQLRAEAAQAKAREQAREQRRKLEQRQARSLKGTTGDLGQMTLDGTDQDLWAATAKQNRTP